MHGGSIMERLERKDSFFLNPCTICICYNEDNSFSLNNISAVIGEVEEECNCNICCLVYREYTDEEDITVSYSIDDELIKKDTFPVLKEADEDVLEKIEICIQESVKAFLKVNRQNIIAVQEENDRRRIYLENKDEAHSYELLYLYYLNYVEDPKLEHYWLKKWISATNKGYGKLLRKKRYFNLSGTYVMKIRRKLRGTDHEAF